MTLTDVDDSSFGTLLKALRVRRRLTQQQLAQAIGVHRSSIVRWEQGDFLPESKALILELARHLHLDEQESRRLLEASLIAISPYWLVPLPRNPFFTGRAEILETLHTQLSTDQAVALTQSSALHGLGGMGKTQIALEYAYRYALEYSAVFWIAAETEEQIISSLLRIADVLQLPGRDDKDQQRVAAAVQRWLSTHSQWLLIWDNIEDLTLLDRFLPAVRSGVLLLTTRRHALGTFAQGLDLSPMEQEEGALFLLRRAKMLPAEATPEQRQQWAAEKPAEDAAARELVTVLGGLPLALDQAGAYLETTRCGVAAYLNLFRTRRAALLEQRGEGARSHPASVSTTFTLALTVTIEQHPAAWDLLRVCAFLQPDAIPEELFLQGGEHLGPLLQATCADPLEWNRIVAAASSSSLLSRQPEEHTVSLHRLVQAVVLDSLTEIEREQWAGRAIETLNAVFLEVRPSTESAIWKQAERVLPHALLCLQQGGQTKETLSFASLAHKVGLYLHVRGQYTQARPLYQRVLHMREQLLGSEHLLVASSLHELATLAQHQGNYTEGEALHQRSLQIRERVLGSDHPDVASSLNNLASIYSGQGKYAEAEPLNQRALSIREQSLGPEHPLVAGTLNNLALLYTDQGKYLDAEPLYQRALRIWEQQLGSEHPEMGASLHNLALLYHEQGKYAEAEPLYQRALQIWEQTLGPDHPRVALSLDNLADLYFKQGKSTQGEPLEQRALRIREQQLGPDHPLVAESLNNLANLSREQGKDKEAEMLYQRARSIREQHLGPHHPETAQTFHDLAVFRQKQGRLSEALSLAERALQTRSQSLGDAHPKTAATRTLHAQLVQQQTDLEKGTASEPQINDRQNGFQPEPVGEEREALSADQTGDRAPAESDPLQAFLADCCEQHSRAWIEASTLWQAYEQWVDTHQERFPLSRRAFTAQLKAHGFRPGRTRAARLWSGLTLREKQRDAT